MFKNRAESKLEYLRNGNLCRGYDNYQSGMLLCVESEFEVAMVDRNLSGLNILSLLLVLNLVMASYTIVVILILFIGHKPIYLHWKE